MWKLFFLFLFNWRINYSHRDISATFNLRLDLGGKPSVDIHIAMPYWKKNKQICSERLYSLGMLFLWHTKALLFNSYSKQNSTANSGTLYWIYIVLYLDWVSLVIYDNLLSTLGNTIWHNMMKRHRDVYPSGCVLWTIMTPLPCEN